MINTLMKIFVFIFAGGLLLSNPYKPLDIEFLKQKPKKIEPVKKQQAKPKKENPKKGFQ